MIVYEVNLDVDAEIAPSFRAWLDEHITEMLGLPGFTKATLFAREDPLSPRGVSWTVHYSLIDRAALDAYLREHAPRMRDDGTRRFGGRFDAARRVLRVEVSRASGERP